MADRTSYTRINIYLDDPTIRTRVKIAAAHRGVSMSTYCLDAIKSQLDRDQQPGGQHDADDTDTARDTAESLDQIRRFVGRVGVPASTLVAEGRKR